MSAKVERTNKRKFKGKGNDGEKKFHKHVYELFNKITDFHPKKVRTQICDDMTIQEHMWMQIALMHICENERTFMRKNIETQIEKIWKYAPFICPDVIEKVENKDEYVSFNLHLSVTRIKNHLEGCPNCPYNSLVLFENIQAKAKSKKEQKN